MVTLVLVMPIKKFGEKYLDDYNELQNFRVNWTHNQDAKARPDRSVFGKCECRIKRIYRYQNTTSRQYLQNELSSSITFNKNWIESHIIFQRKSITIKIPF